MSIATFLGLLPHDLDSDAAHGWLSPRTVEGFREEDFAFLTADERERLRRSVEQFRDEVTSNDVTIAKRPAPEEKVRRAKPYLKEILEIMAPDRYADADALRLGKGIEALVGWGKPDCSLPGWVTMLKFETGNDHTGDAAIWIWVISEDAIFDSPDFSEQAASVRSALFDAARTTDASRWPFVRLRSVSDERLLLQESSQ